MKTIGTHNYYVYIVSNALRNVFYIGVSNNLERRLLEHKNDSLQDKITFAGKYNCTDLIFWERFQWIKDAIAREKELKKWRREKKLDLIRSFNPELKSFNDEI